MANEIIANEYPLPKENYVAFDAISLRNLIIQRLNDQGIFTDQNYIGSNLACIIDIVSYAFNTLIYYLNRTSNESTFTEAQLYENISRIVKLLDYKPIGFQTSTLAFQCSASNFTNLTDYIIPRYSYLMVGNIPFSFNEDIAFNINSTNLQELTDLSNRKLLYQGVYRESPLYTAAGDPSEIVTINTPNIQIDHFNLDVYVYEKTQGQWFQYVNVPNLYSEQAFSRSFEKRLNSNLLYEITFGDGINGRKLEQGDQVAIYYLQSTGDNGIVGPNVLSTATKTIYSTTQYNTIRSALVDTAIDLLQSNFNNLSFNNVVGSTVPKNIETADEIRKNAPANFKSQYRLVTKEDYQTFIKTNFANFINDAKVFSNWDYTSAYLKYFNDIDVSLAAYRQILLNQVLYADSCNFNNIYICCVPKVSQGSSLKYLLPAQKEIILSNILPLKTLTTEVVFVDPIFKAVSIGTKTNGDVAVSDREFCQLEIIKTPTNRRSNRSLATDVANVFRSFFNPVNAMLGGTLQYQSLVASILAIDGVSKIRTRRLDTNEFVEGLSLFVWNPTYADLDKQAIVADLKLEDFAFVYFDGLTNIDSKIVIIEQTNGLQ